MAVDISVENHGSICLVRTHTRAGRSWIKDNVQDDAQYLGDALAVEPRYLDNLVAGMRADGLVVR